MTTEEADEFVKFVDGGWKPPLTPVEQQVWREVCTPLDPRTAFTVLMRLLKTEQFRPPRPDFMGVYRREMIDTTPHQPLVPTDRDEMPEWVPGWFIAHREGDQRLWPEMEKGARELHAFWLETVGPKFAKEHGLKSGYEWEADVAARGIMPQSDRLAYIQRAKDGEAPASAEAMAGAMAGGA